MLFSPKDAKPAPAVGEPDGDALDNPKNPADVLQKHAALKADAQAGKRGPRGPYKKNKPPTAGGADPGNGPVPLDLFKGKALEPVVAAPFKILGVVLKSDAFDLDDVEKKDLADQGALVANLYAPNWNPKAVALTAFSLAFLAITAEKFVAYKGEKAMRNRDKEELEKGEIK